ncbi:radical SAM protein [Halomicrococcus gelatinilyticus]|uniref:radical SAM protein n=1 Tax=Halomicrococcus gelatinilyticus TaxID=1702103 RepID=UPI002E1585BD
MSLHVVGGTECNMGCDYCYEEPAREIENENGMAVDYDMDAIIDRLSDWKEKKPNSSPGLHGGEPLLMANEDIDRLFGYMNEHWDRGPSIQTNGSLIKDEHVDLFEKHGVNVGISCDGPPALNANRKARHGGDDVTEEYSVRTNRAITRLVEADGTSVGIIVVLNEANAGTDEQLEKLLSWVDNLNRMGVTGHFNPAIPYEDENVEDVALDPERLTEVYERAAEWLVAEEHREFGPFDQHLDNLLGNGLGNCVNNKCDVSNAGAAQIIKGDGTTTGCGKTWNTFGDGTTFLQGDTAGNEYGERTERYDVLRQLPGWTTDDEPDLGGCKGCRYWAVCQGGCPSAGLNDDWRNRSIMCRAKYAAYETLEDHLRSALPNVRLITDLPWDADVSDTASYDNLDIKPFGGIRPGADGPSSANRYGRHPESVVEAAGGLDEVLPDDQSFERKVEFWHEEYDEEVVEVDYERQNLHADSNVTRRSDVGDAERTDRRCGCGSGCGCGRETAAHDASSEDSETDWERVDDGGAD